MMIKFNEISKSFLQEMYYNKKMSLSEISKKLGKNPQTILNWMKKHEIPRRSYSESLKGRDHSWGNKISNSLIGHKHSILTKNKISENCKGRVSIFKGMRKSTHNEKIKWGCKNEKHWNWKGGISSINSLIRQTSEYKYWRDSVFKRDNYTCQFCEKKGGLVHAHHIIPLSTLLKCEDHLKNDLLYCIDNGWTTCIPCHKEIHAFKRKK